MKNFKKPAARTPKSSPRRADARPPARQAQRSPTPSQKPNGRAVAGVHATRELIKVRPHAISEMWLREGFETHADLKDLADRARARRVTIKIVGPGTLDKVVAVHQGVVAFATEQPELSFADLKAKTRATLLVLDEVEDPHNLGAVLRTAWLFGVDGVLTPELRTAPLSATVAKVAQGAVEHVPIMRDTSLQSSLNYLKEQGFWVYGLSAGGTKTLYQTEIPEKVIWVLGSESSGIRKPIERACDELIGIPQIDPNASFNVSVAAALAIGETFRQRGPT